MSTLARNGITSQSSQDHSRSDFDQQWRSYAARRKLAATLLYPWPMACAALFLFGQYYLHQLILLIMFLAVWFTAAVAAVWWAGQFRCPRCYRRFGALGNKKSINLTRGFFDSVCSNCKLAKFERAA